MFMGEGVGVGVGVGVTVGADVLTGTCFPDSAQHQYLDGLELHAPSRSACV